MKLPLFLILLGFVLPAQGQLDSSMHLIPYPKGVVAGASRPGSAFSQIQQRINMLDLNADRRADLVAFHKGVGQMVVYWNLPGKAIGDTMTSLGLGADVDDYGVQIQAVRTGPNSKPLAFVTIPNTLKYLARYNAGGYVATDTLPETRYHAFIDIDRDGDDDMLFTLDSMVMVRRNTMGNFGTDSVLLRLDRFLGSGHRTVIRIIGIDVENDGAMEVVVRPASRNAADSLRIYKRHPVGYQLHQSLKIPTSGEGLLDLKVGDMNYDGLPDMIAYAYHSNHDPVYDYIQNRGGGFFNPSSQGSWGREPYTFFLTNPEGDRRGKLAKYWPGSNSGYPAMIYLAKVFTVTSERRALEVGGYFDPMIAAADVDGDSKTDLIFNAGDQGINFYTRSFLGPDSLGPPKHLYTIGQTKKFNPLRVKGLPRGHIQTDGASVYFLPEGDPMAVKPIRVLGPMLKYGTNTILFPEFAGTANIQGDTTPELFFSTNSGLVVASLRENSTYRLLPESQVSRGSFFTIGDANEDGFPDLFYRTEGNGPFFQDTIYMALGQSGGTFALPARLGPLLGGRFETSGQWVRDFDRDGHLDLVQEVSNFSMVTLKSSYGYRVAYGNGNGTFQPSLTLSPSGMLTESRYIVDDLNQDGLEDVVHGYLGSLNIGIQQPGHTFQYRQLGGISPLYKYLGSTRMDSDSVPDLVFDSGTYLRVFRGQPTGGFDSLSVLSLGSRGGRELLDLWGDGRKEVIMQYVGGQVAYSALRFQIFVSVAEPEKTAGGGTLRLYPNPAHSSLRYILPQNTTAQSLALIDAVGRRTAVPLGTSNAISLIGQKPGVYILEVTTQGGKRLLSRFAVE